MHSTIKRFAGRTLDGECREISIHDGIIVENKRIPAKPDLPYLLPVLVDLQHNGAFGIEFNTLAKASSEQLDLLANHLRKHGVGRCLASFATQDIGLLADSMSMLASCLEKDRALSQLFSGFFQEGVFISPKAGWRGAHQEKFIKAPDFAEFLRLWEASGKRIKVVNVAPEEPGGIEFIQAAVAKGIKVAIGHCNPSPDIVKRSVEAGASMITHLGNGAAPLIDRFDNPFWAMLNEAGLAAGMVGDGFHLPPEFIGVALKCKKQNCFMVSDSSFFAGSPPGKYMRSDGSGVVVTPEFKIHTEKNPNILAGAWFQLDRSVEFLVQRCAVDFVEAWKLCSLYPAHIAGISLPELVNGDEASFVVAKWEHNALRLLHSIHGGKDFIEEQ